MTDVNLLLFEKTLRYEEFTGPKRIHRVNVAFQPGVPVHHARVNPGFALIGRRHFDFAYLEGLALSYSWWAMQPLLQREGRNSHRLDDLL